MPRSLLPFMLVLALPAGCASNVDFPSLASRPIERAAQEQPPLPPQPEPGADPAVVERSDGIVASGEAGHRSFLAELAAARPLIERASGSAAGEERWVAAQQAYTAVDAARGPLLAALTDLDALRREQAEGPNPANRAALDRAAERLGALDAEESSALAELAARLG